MSLKLQVPLKLGNVGKTTGGSNSKPALYMVYNDRLSVDPILCTDGSVSDVTDSHISVTQLGQILTVENIVHKTHWVMGDLTNPDGTITKGTEPRATGLKIDAIRRDEVPGIHSITYDSYEDTITITHDAHNRSGFALGAVIAAEFTNEHSGMLGMSDLLNF